MRLSQNQQFLTLTSRIYIIVSFKNQNFVDLDTVQDFNSASDNENDESENEGI